MNNGNLSHQLTVSEQREGGIASGESRRRKRDLREAILTILESDIEYEGTVVSGSDALAMAIFQKGIKGNVQAFAQIRDTVYGKPTINVQSDVIPQEVYDRVSAALAFDDDEHDESDAT